MSNLVPEEVGRELLILVPKSGWSPSPVKGSGIVGSYSLRREVLQVDFEGNLYGAENLKSYWERLYHSAGRHVTGYATVAREYYACGAAFPYWVVGTFNYPEAVAHTRSTKVSVKEAVRMACDLDLTYKEILETWIGESV